MRIGMYALISLLLLSCAPSVKTKLSKTLPPLDYKEDVALLSLYDDVPPSAIKIGTFKVGDGGISSNCGWDVVTELAKTEARKAGGNVVKITEHIPPSAMGSSCDRIKGEIIKVENPADLLKYKQAGSAKTDSTWDYAKLYVYRPGGAGALIGYDLYLDDSLICRVKNNRAVELKIRKQGKSVIWAKTESRTEVPITIEFGREYYLQCGMTMGIMVGRPSLQLVSKNQGKALFNEMKAQ